MAGADSKKYNFENQMNKVLYFITLLILTGCCPGGISTKDNGPLPESALLFVPYQNDSMYSFQHSKGEIISFKTSRETFEDYYACTECCVHNQFETNQTTMVSESFDYDISIEISNLNTEILHCYLNIGKYSFYIPTPVSQYPYYEIADSLEIDSCIYFDVLKLGEPQTPTNYYDYISLDSLYYNQDYGILKIVFSSGEYYKRISNIN